MGTYNDLIVGIPSLAPVESLSLLVTMAIKRLNRAGDKMSPYFTPRIDWIGSNNSFPYMS